jgi:hypothetical protein
MKITITVLIALFALSAYSQKTKEDIEAHRSAHKTELLDTNGHMMNAEEIAEFGGLDYFDFDSTFQVEVLFTKDKGKKFEMPTSTERTPIYRRYGYIDFMIDSVPCRLTVYQNIEVSKDKAYKNYLFIPYKDKTTRSKTYGGGRFLDFEIPEKPTAMLDFNLSYNPYCAYSHRYSCPIPPSENTLEVAINAGEKTPHGH